MLKHKTNKAPQPKATSRVMLWLVLAAELVAGAFEAAWLFRGLL